MSTENMNQNADPATVRGQGIRHRHDKKGHESVKEHIIYGD